MKKNSKLEVFCGTGGVGKTTLSLARALYHSEISKKRVALITIDPSKRLKDLIGLTDLDSGDLVEKKLPQMEESISVLLMNPQKTFDKMKTDSADTKAQKNRILELLMKPYGGMNEIMSVVELKNIIDQEQFDIIVLDTPPGSHFIDFLQSMKKINTFFDSSWIEFFNNITEKVSNTVKPKSFLKTITSSGIKKILGYLEKITGSEFTQEFVQTVSEFYLLKNNFLNAIKLQDILKDSSHCDWFLITAADQTKIEQAHDLANKSRIYAEDHINTIINKTFSAHFDESEVLESKVASYFITNEKKLFNKLMTTNKSPFLFPELSFDNYQDQMISLMNHWKKYEN